MKLGARLLRLWGWLPSQSGDSCALQPGPEGSVSWPPGPLHQGRSQPSASFPAFSSSWAWKPESREKAFMGDLECEGEGGIEYPVIRRQDVIDGG